METWYYSGRSAAAARPCSLTLGFQLSFVFGDALVERSDGGFHFGFGETGRAVFWAVPVERDYINEEPALDAAAQCGRGRELVGELQMLAGVEDADVAEPFQSLLARVIHEEQRDAVADGEVARS